MLLIHVLHACLNLHTDELLCRIFTIMYMCKLVYSKILVNPYCRRIRDQLLQDDRFSLAMEISTKCNLDSISVWASWGMAWLKVGNFEKAKEKLKHCFLVWTKSIC